MTKVYWQGGTFWVSLHIASKHFSSQDKVVGTMYTTSCRGRPNSSYSLHHYKRPNTAGLLFLIVADIMSNMSACVVSLRCHTYLPAKALMVCIISHLWTPVSKLYSYDTYIYCNSRSSCSCCRHFNIHCTDMWSAWFCISIQFHFTFLD